MIGLLKIFYFLFVAIIIAILMLIFSCLRFYPRRRRNINILIGILVKNSTRAVV